NSSLSYQEYHLNVNRIMKNEIKLVYLAPETLLMPKTLSIFSSLKVDCLTIDEAHCISEWGHDFRPEYRNLVEVRGRFPSATCIALTATATPRVQEDIKKSLSLNSSNEFIASFNRENLFIQVAIKANPFLQTIEMLKRYPEQSGIVYCFSRSQVDELYEALKRRGVSVKPYHAGLTDDERMKNQESFIRDDIQIIVATIAFGMGINKPNIRFVIHYDLPKNIESYYQEIGRAGRDGLRSHCLLLFSYADIQKIKYFINQKEEDKRRIANIQLNALLRFAETDLCRRIPMLTYFGEDYSKEKCDMCDNCLTGERKLVDITISAQKFLSCVKRCDEIFGTNHIIDILRGSQSQKVLKFGHQNLSTYSIGKDYSRRQWFHLSRQFIQKGLMTQDMEFGGLKLTQKAYNVFAGREVVMGMLEEERVDYTKTREMEQEYDHILFEVLRKKRKELADKANLPPYVIFPDKTLIEMAVYFPQSNESLLGIYGLGSTKLERYGKIFLDIICQYCHEHQIEEQPKRRKREKLGFAKKQRHIIVGEEFNAGKSVEEIMTDFDIKCSTVLNHLLEYIKEGYALRSDGLLSLSTISPDQQTAVLMAFEKLGTAYLKPIFEALGGNIGYDELRILQVYCLSKEIVTLQLLKCKIQNH
ncbi:RecQ family ATP-dependent DNA helicase, partial [bacterium]|nr:RecQ family ATP-dependent DNA helicase [bacterium]